MQMSAIVGSFYNQIFPWSLNLQSRFPSVSIPDEMDGWQTTGRKIGRILASGLCRTKRELRPLNHFILAIVVVRGRSTTIHKPTAEQMFDP